MAGVTKQDSRTPLAPQSTTSFGSLDPVGGQPSEAPIKTKGSFRHRNSIIFPFEPFKCCCNERILGYVPSAWLTIQSWSHLILIVGSLSMVLLLVESVHGLSTAGCLHRFCQSRIAPLVFTSCCLGYFLKTIPQYDGQLQDKKDACLEARLACDKSYEESAESLAEALSSAMDTSSGLAERNFEGKRRDFLRFLRKFSEEVGADSGVLAGFVVFLKQWLKVFEETAVNPVTNPHRLKEAWRLDKCATVAEACALIGDELKESPVQFVSGQRDTVTADLNGIRDSWTSKAKQQAKKLKAKVMGSDSFEAGKLEAGLSTVSLKDFDVNPEVSHSIFSLGLSGKVCLDLSNADETNFPCDVHCVFFRWTLLSIEHLMLFVGFLLCALILYFEVMVTSKFADRTLVVVENVFCLICIGFVLWDFQDIDIIQQLVVEKLELEEQNRRIEAKREEMLAFVSTIQEYSDLWLHRTIPRLELLKQFYWEALDAPADKRVALLHDVTSNFAVLEGSLPELARWCGEQCIGEERKKTLGDIVLDLTREVSVAQTLQRMPAVSGKIMEVTASIPSADDAGPSSFDS